MTRFDASTAVSPQQTSQYRNRSCTSTPTAWTLSTLLTNIVTKGKHSAADSQRMSQILKGALESAIRVQDSKGALESAIRVHHTRHMCTPGLQNGW